MQSRIGLFRGTVVRHELNGQCKVFIKEIYPPEYENKPDMLPDAEIGTPIFGGGVCGNGMFSYPNIGTTVWVMFQNGDQNLPVILAQTLGGGGSNKQYKKLIKMSGEVDDAYEHVMNIGKSKITISETGYVEILTQEGENYSKLTMNCDGNVIVDSSNSITLTTDKMFINADQHIFVTTQIKDEKNTFVTQITTPQFRVKASELIELNSPSNQKQYT